MDREISQMNIAYKVIENVTIAPSDLHEENVGQTQVYDNKNRRFMTKFIEFNTTTNHLLIEPCE